jgi:hypothetical protein
MEQQTKRRKTQESAERATFLSTDDIKSLEAEPGCCPSTYYGMLNLLKRYIRLLNVLFGTRCAHLLEVQGVYQVLAKKAAVYETIRQRMLQSIGPMLPESALYSLRHYIRSCSLKVVTINCPVALVLLNLRSGAMVISQSSMGSGRTGLTARMSGGSMAPSTMSTLTSSSSTRRSGAVPVAGGKRKNPEPIPEFVSLMHDLRTQQPGTDIHALFRSEKLLISDIGVGGRGTCLDFTSIRDRELYVSGLRI